MEYAMRPTEPARVRLADGPFKHRFELNRRYLLSLRSEALLQPYLQEAGLQNRVPEADDHLEDLHWGWESPTCQLRGHFLGHWLSGAARTYAAIGDAELKGRADAIVSELARCQESNGGEWVASIPEKFLYWISGELPRKRIWAPHYTLHKTLMGLVDMAVYARSEQALEVADRFSRRFHRWSAGFTREQFDDVLDYETGGMLEAWADLYGISGKPEHRELMERYTRPRLFDPLLAGADPLTNMHANTTIPEAQGAARAYEVTGDERWRRIVEAYWKCAVTDRGTFCTGGQTSGEIWTPPFEYAARRGDKNQEFCTVYNMIRLANYLFRWTAKPEYQDYIERNLYNGVLAQQHPGTGMVAYFLPLEPGARKVWGHPTRDFWCCHGTLVQAHAAYPEWTWFSDADGLVLAQYIPSEARWDAPDGTPVTVSLATAPSRGSSSDNEAPAGQRHRPRYWWFELKVRCERPAEFALKIRLPGWLAGKPRITVNGDDVTIDAAPGSFASVRRTWSDDTIRVVLPTALRTHAIPDEPGTVAFVDGPVALAGLCGEERTLVGDPARPETMLAPDNEREWGVWLPGYRAVNQRMGLRFIPLHAVVDQPYTVYFPVREE